MFDVVLADPCWWYANRLTGEGRTKFGSGASGKYDTLKAHEIIDPTITYDMSKIAKENCVLFLWVTMPLLYDSKRRKPTWKPTENWQAPHDALTVIHGWGFDYVANGFTWVKLCRKNHKKIFSGVGHYTASNTEVCLVATRGVGMTPKAWGGKMLTPEILISPVMEHSRKPDIHKKIEKMYPGANYVELFARRQYPGWVCLGNEMPDGSETNGIGVG